MPLAPLALLPARRLLPVFARGTIALPAAVTYSSQPRCSCKSSSAPSTTLRRLASWVPRAGMASEAPPFVVKHDASNCIFCKILAGTIPSYKLFETEHTLAFLDAFPMTPGHTLLIPKTHSPFMEDMSPEAAAELGRELPRLAKAVRGATGAQGVNIVQNNGSAAGQVVFHVHFHILPRSPNDGLLHLGDSGPMIDSKEAKAMQAKLVERLQPASSI